MSVHGSHCCSRCGCKYGYKDCPVILGTEKEVYACFECVYRVKKIEKLAKFLCITSESRIKLTNLQEAEMIYEFVKDLEIKL